MTQAEVRRLLDPHPPDQRVGRALELLQAFPVGVEEAGAVAKALSQLVDEGGASRDDLARRLEGLGTPSARVAAAWLLDLAGETVAALAAWQRAMDELPGPDSTCLLRRGLLAARAGEMERAASDLRAALHLLPPYPFYRAAERLLGRVVKSGDWTPKRKVRVALLGGPTTAFLRPVLELALFRDGIAAEVYEGQFGGFRQEMLDPKSGLYAFRPDIAIIATHWRDAGLPPHCASPDGELGRIAGEFAALWGTLLSRHPCSIIQHLFDAPAPRAWGTLQETLPGGAGRVLERTNLRIAEQAPDQVSVMRLDDLELEESLEDWIGTRQAWPGEQLPRIASRQAAHIRAILGLTKKVLVCDLDNTLWGGVIGEDGLEGIKLGGNGTSGEGYVELHRMLLELKSRGVLLAVCSKNNQADAELPFREHPETVLRLDDFVAFVANWRDKAENLRALADTLSLGLDSFVFLDDSAVERAWVRQELPEVVVPEVEATPWSMIAALERGAYFDAIRLTSEDAVRHQAYQENVARTSFQVEAGSMGEFLQGLGMEAENGPVDEVSLQRVTQLINKTNQFNLTTRRYTEAQVREIIQSDTWWTRWFRLRDRFGDYGQIGAMLVEKGEGGRWRVDTWVMSCRALGREMEVHMLDVLADDCAKEGGVAVVGEYIPTEKNGQVADLYPRLGFSPAAAGESLFVLSVAATREPLCAAIRNATAVS